MRGGDARTLLYHVGWFCLLIITAAGRSKVPLTRKASRTAERGASAVAKGLPSRDEGGCVRAAPNQTAVANFGEAAEPPPSRKCCAPQSTFRPSCFIQSQRRCRRTAASTMAGCASRRCGKRGRQTTILPPPASENRLAGWLYGHVSSALAGGSLSSTLNTSLSMPRS